VLNFDRIIVHMVAVALFTVLMTSPELARAAAREVGPLSVTVQYHSTELTTPQGVAGLYRRIRAAASAVCDPFYGAPLEDKLRWNECFNHAVANAVASIQNESLSAYHWRQIRGWKRLDAPTSLAGR
jgi:UrcA family protein